jgi:hypothetical protein
VSNDGPLFATPPPRIATSATNENPMVLGDADER